MTQTNAATNVLKMNDTAPLAVIIGGTFEGIVTGAYQLQRTIADGASMRGETVTEDWIAENVVTYPVLTAEPIELSYDVNREWSFTFEETSREDVTYYIDDIDTEFDSQEEMESFIEASLNEHDYTVEQIKCWDIERRTKEPLDIEIEGEDDVEITAYGANKMVCYYVEAPEPTPPPEPMTATIVMDVDYEAMTSEQLLEQTNLIQAVVEGRIDTIEEAEVPTTLHREHAYFMHAEHAMTRFLKGSPCYLFVDGDVIGMLAIGEEELRGHIRKGHSVGRHWGKQYDAE